MKKYLLCKVFCDDEEVPVPDLFILPLTPDLGTEIQCLAEFTKAAKGLTPVLEAIEFKWNKGYWIQTGDPNYLPDDVAIMENDDIMAIVGDDVRVQRLVVEPDGDLHFRGIHDDSHMHLRTEPINIERLQEACQRK